jgi:DNA-binding NarL/FixJ family response regulator
MHDSSAAGITDRAINRAELTAREVQVLKLLLAAKADKEIANHLGISLRTAKSHVSSILRKFRCASRMELACQLLPVVSA